MGFDRTKGAVGDEVIANDAIVTRAGVGGHSEVDDVGIGRPAHTGDLREVRNRKFNISGGRIDGIEELRDRGHENSE